MAISVRLDDVFVENTKVYANVAKRTLPKQIEHWAEIRIIVEDNPDLPYEFVKEALLAKAGIESGLVSRYVRRKKHCD